MLKCFTGWQIKMKLLLLHKKVVLQKTAGKGGWTYAVIPNVITRKGERFGWVLADLVIDDVEARDIKLFAMKNGKLFVPLKAELRRKIKKEAGDRVELKIFANNKIKE
jgi:hypothetical protein